MIKRIVSLFIVLCLLFSLFCVTASASYIYEVDKSAVLMSSAPLSVSDSGISTAAVEPSDLDDYLSYGSYSAADYLASLNQYFWGTTVPKYSGYTFITNLTELFRDFFNSTGWYLGDDGTVTNVNYSNSIADLVRMGFRGLSVNVQAVTSAIQALDINNYSTILNSIYSSVDGLETGLTSANTAIGGVTTAVNNVRSSVNNVVTGLSTVNTSVGTVNSTLSNFTSTWTANNLLPVGLGILEESGAKVNNSSKAGMAYIVSRGFLGLRNYIANQLVLSSGRPYLGSDGVEKTYSSDISFVDALRLFALGLSSNIKGSETDNVYSSTLNDNNNATTTVNSTGLGPLLNTQLSNIGENLGHLAYIFASDDDIKLKEDSQPLVDATDSFFDDSDTNVKVSADNIGSLKNVAGDFLDIVDTGADVGDAVSIVTNANSFRWFTAQTAADIDSIGTATVSDEESTYDRLHREFNEIYFPDRVGGGN